MQNYFVEGQRIRSHVNDMNAHSFVVVQNLLKRQCAYLYISFILNKLQYYFYLGNKLKMIH